MNKKRNMRSCKMLLSILIHDCRERIMNIRRNQEKIQQTRMIMKLNKYSQHLYNDKFISEVE